MVIASFNHLKAALFVIIASWIHIFAIFSVLFILFYLRSPFLSVIYLKPKFLAIKRRDFFRKVTSVWRLHKNNLLVSKNPLPTVGHFSRGQGKVCLSCGACKRRFKTSNNCRLTHSASELSGFTCTSSLTINEALPNAVFKISSSLFVNEYR